MRILSRTALRAAAAVLAPAALAVGQDLLRQLGGFQDFLSRRVSSFDRSGGNRDALTIKPGETAVLADLQGPGAIHHFWVTISAEPFYGRKIVLRMYWDGETAPSVEAPIGDFFGVGHGLNRNFASLPLVCSSEGRARNSFWYMPFRKSARVTVANEGRRDVAAFYYYLDYRVLPSLPTDTPTFHAQYRQETPCAAGRNYLILEAQGRGHYVGCHLSVFQKAMGWWGEGDDMIIVDGEDFPSLHGTGSEDYFADAWGMRESQSLFYGCPLQEEDFQAGSKASVYRFHIPDPIPFRKSISVSIEHGHDNDRADDFSSTAYWYQSEPHRPFLALPTVEARLPFALEPPPNFVLPAWKEAKADLGQAFEDAEKGLAFKGGRLVLSKSSYYLPSGERYPVLATDGPTSPSVHIGFPVGVAERYDVTLFFLKGPNMGIWRPTSLVSAGSDVLEERPDFSGYAEAKGMGALSLKSVSLSAGPGVLELARRGKARAASGDDLAFLGLSLVPSERRYLTEWNVIGPFAAPDMDALTVAYPPERELDLEKSYAGGFGKTAVWRKARAGAGGYVNLLEFVQPGEYVIAYALGFVEAPSATEAVLLLGSDDGVRAWVNGELVHTNAAYRASAPDLDKVAVRLNKGRNAVLLKILQGAGAWGFHARFADPEGGLRWSADRP
ncbi:MAG: DUF2961 domain-containing protein [Candidatus Aminicenantes bacterium]|nr:DUF2961 domain-containing protein [Candidatus Aminicenantes bacterium]